MAGHGAAPLLPVRAPPPTVCPAPRPLSPPQSVAKVTIDPAAGLAGPVAAADVAVDAWSPGPRCIVNEPLFVPKQGAPRAQLPVCVCVGVGRRLGLLVSPACAVQKLTILRAAPQAAAAARTRGMCWSRCTTRPLARAR